MNVSFLLNKPLFVFIVKYCFYIFTFWYSFCMIRIIICVITIKIYFRHELGINNRSPRGQSPYQQNSPYGSPQGVSWFGFFFFIYFKFPPYLGWLQNVTCFDVTNRVTNFLFFYLYYRATNSRFLFRLKLSSF